MDEATVQRAIASLHGRQFCGVLHIQRNCGLSYPMARFVIDDLVERGYLRRVYGAEGFWVVCTSKLNAAKGVDWGDGEAMKKCDTETAARMAELEAELSEARADIETRGQQLSEERARVLKLQDVLALEVKERQEANRRLEASRAIAHRESIGCDAWSDRAVKAEKERDDLAAAVRVLAEYGGAAHGLGGPFKCWDSRRMIDAFDAVLGNPIAWAAVMERAKAKGGEG